MKISLPGKLFPCSICVNPWLNAIFGSVVLTLAVAAGMALGQARAVAADNQNSAAEKQRKLISVLQSDAPPQDKAIACKQLAVYGAKDAVPALAPLLADQRLASWARIALEAIPDPAADDALRAAMGNLQGRLLIGVINSIGYRRDAKAVAVLADKLKDADVDVASAAAAALGRIGGEPAAKALERALASAPGALRAEVAQGCILCAERFLAEGKRREAVTLYDTVRKANVPKQKMLEATRGAILARQSAGLGLLIQQLTSADKALFGIGLRTARELPGRQVTEALAAELERASPDRQALLALVLADRGDTAALPALGKLARTGPKSARMAALGALEQLNDGSCLPVLLQAAAEDDAELAKTAKAALARLPGKQVDAELLARLPQAAGKTRQVLIELAGQRGIEAALPAIVQSAEAPDAGVRRAAVGAIGALGQDRQVGDLVRLIQNAQSPSEREDIQKALLAISARRGASCLPYLLPLAQSSDSALRMIALQALSSIGGPAALAAVQSAIEDKDEEVQDEAVRTLSTWANNWPDDAGVAAPLLALAKSGKKKSHQALGLRGYLQYLQEDKKLNDEEKLAKVNEVLPLLGTAADKRSAISVLNAISSAGALELLLSFAADPAIAEEAFSASVNLAAKNDLKGASKQLRERALQTATEKSKDERTKKKAAEALNKLQ
jgi:HEAT repeat protein